MNDNLDHAYRQALAEHLNEETEESLSRAYDLGRQALAADFGILDVLLLYDAAFRDAVLTASPAEQSVVALAITNFYREFLSPFEMSFRGYREANLELLRLNEVLATTNTELKQKQTQLIQAAKMASLGELVAGIAHEINNPLAFIISHLKTIEKCLSRARTELGTTVTVAAAELLDRAMNRLHESELGAQRIKHLVVKLRTFSRLDEGERKVVSMRESIQSVLTIVEHRCLGRIDILAEFGEPDLVDCYPSLINQAVMNLVANAMDAIHESGTIWLTTARDVGDFVITVADSGHGIPADLRDRVREPFFTTKPIGEGTGLGLSITHSIVHKHGGTLDLAPRPGGGTVATIRFPLLSDVS